MDMKTVEIFNWGHARADVIEDCGFARPEPVDRPLYHGTYTVTENHMWSIVRQLYDGGLNVQVQHRTTLIKGRVTLLCLILVDKGFFRQR